MLRKQPLVNAAASADSLTMSRAEVRSVRAAERTQRKQSVREARTAKRTRIAEPGVTSRGFHRRRAGRSLRVEPAPEMRGTSVQVCGLWPFVAGSGHPPIGTPLGTHLRTGEVFCCDPVTWFLRQLILTPSAFVLGRPGLGKSTLVRRMVTVLEAWGIVPMILADLKPDYVPLIEAMKGQVIRIGRGMGCINPLDFGPLWAQISDLPPEARDIARKDMRRRRLRLVSGLVALAMRRDITTLEETILNRSVILAEGDITDRQIVISDLTDLIEGEDKRVRAVAQDRGDDNRFHSVVDEMIAGLKGLCDPDGSFGDIFAGPTTVTIEVGRPLVFDLSSIDDSETQLQAAAQLVCWQLGSTVVASAKYLSDAGKREPLNAVLIMDELWNILQSGPFMVGYVNKLSRLNRQRGLAQILITHTMDDLKLETEKATNMAFGLVERSSLVFLGGLAEAEMGNLRHVFHMSEEEVSEITGWATDSTIDPNTGTASAPPGQGKFLVKKGKDPGIPFQVQLFGIERDVNDTNKAWAHAMNKAPRTPDQIRADDLAAETHALSTRDLSDDGVSI